MNKNSKGQKIIEEIRSILKEKEKTTKLLILFSSNIRTQKWNSQTTVTGRKASSTAVEISSFW